MCAKVRGGTLGVYRNSSRDGDGLASGNAGK